MKSKYFNLLCLLCILFNAYKEVKGISKVVLENNGYENVVIAISPSIPENVNLIEAIKKSFTEASSVLLNATHNRSFFKNITIVVPEKWSGSYARATEEAFANADVLIADPNFSSADKPYTLQYGNCGDRGIYIHFTPDYMLNNDYVVKYGRRGKVIVHEWAHFRWGVFDETVTEGYPFFFRSINGIEAPRCPDDFKGDFKLVNSTTKIKSECKYNGKSYEPNKDCEYVPFDEQHQNDSLRTSVMSYYNFDQVTTFCHSNQSDPINLHYKEAPNEHNRLCEMQSTWDVILKSEDFRDGKNPENLTIADTTPTFTIVQAVPEQHVLVMDVSGSMRGSRLELMRKAANQYIDTFVPNGVYVGLVKFSSIATILSGLNEITGSERRKTLISQLPTGVGGATGIGSGILLGLQVLRNGAYGPCGNLIVLSDGDESEKPLVNDVYNNVTQAKCVKMHTIFIDITTNSVNNVMKDLSGDSDGKWFLANAATSESDLTDIFHELSITGNGDVTSKSIKVASDTHSISQSAGYNGTVLIDQTIGNNTVFTFVWKHSQPNVAIKSPQTDCYYANYTSTGLNYCSDHPIHSIETQFKVLKFEIPGIAETGTWSYFISTTSSSDSITVTVTSHAADSSVSPIEAEVNLLNANITAGNPAVIYAKVNQGFTPITNANVTAFVTKPDGVTVRVPLHDHGAEKLGTCDLSTSQCGIYILTGADVRRNDGVYSRYFTDYREGRYTVKLTVIKQTNVTFSSALKASFQSGTAFENGVNANSDEIILNNEATTSTALNFQRTTTGQSFSISGNLPAGDHFPPNKVINLRLQQKNLGNKDEGIVVEFTASGDDYDHGQAQSYDLRYTFSSNTALQTDFESNANVTVMEGSLSNPKSALEEEYFVVATPHLPENEDTVQVWMAVRVYDEEGNPSEVSNVATITFFINETALAVLLPEIVTETTSLTESTSNIPTSTLSIDSVIEEERNLFRILMIVFAGTTLLFAILAIALCITVLRKKGDDKIFSNLYA